MTDIDEIELKPGDILEEKFKLERMIGKGSFGYIFQCTNIKNNRTFAIKIEKRESSYISMIVKEVKILKEMQGI